MRWADADRYGHVNNTVHYQWFDDAVNGWLIDRGLLDLRGGATIGFAVETSCRYARPLDFPGAVEVGLRVDHVGSSSVAYQLGVFTDDEPQAAAQGRFVHVYVDRETRRPQPLEPGWRDALASLNPCGI